MFSLFLRTILSTIYLAALKNNRSFKPILNLKLKELKKENQFKRLIDHHQIWNFRFFLGFVMFQL